MPSLSFLLYLVITNPNQGRNWWSVGASNMYKPIWGQGLIKALKLMNMTPQLGTLKASQSL